MRMLNAIGCTIAAAGLAASGAAQEDTRPRGVIITEIMYNPDSDERRGEAEWVEIANLGETTISIENWKLRDEDTADWAQWAAFSCELPPRGVAVLINGDATTVEEFREAWGINAESDCQIIAIKWGSLANRPSEENEVLELVNGQGEVVCRVNYRTGDGWPSYEGSGGPSVYLTDLTAPDLNVGEVWKKSEVGVDGARSNTKTAAFNGSDVGSPGQLPAVDDAMESRDPGEETDDAEERGSDEIDY